MLHVFDLLELRIHREGLAHTLDGGVGVVTFIFMQCEHSELKKHKLEAELRD